jgi:ABC-2 type transport system permease protein
MKVRTNFFQADLFWQLLRAKCVNLPKKLINECIDYYVWAGCTLFISGHVLQAFGMSKDFGVFQLCAVLAVIGLFGLYGNAITIVSDIENDRSVDYYLSLPTSALTVLASSVAYYTIIGFTTGITLLPLAKLILGGQLVFAKISWAAFLFFLLLTNIFFSTATIAVAALVPSMDSFDVIWVRFIFPLWFLGGFQFSWKAINATVPWLSYLMLANPITYTTEGMRAAMLGQEGYLPFWFCSAMLLVLLVVVARWSYVTFKKRLDFV